MGLRKMWKALFPDQKVETKKEETVIKSLIDNSTNPELEKIYTDALGNDWFVYKNVLEISPARGVAAARADRFVSLRISQHNMEQLLDVAIDGINKEQNFTQAAAILHQLKHRCHFLCEENSLLDLAGIYYFLKDEDPMFPSEHHNTVKRDIWSKDEICKGFFLHMGIQLTKQFSTTPEEDLEKFLRETVEIAEQVYQYIPRT